MELREKYEKFLKEKFEKEAQLTWENLSSVQNR